MKYPMLDGAIKTDVIYCGDSVKLLPNIHPGSIQAIYMDPPFYTRKKHEATEVEGNEERVFYDNEFKTMQDYISKLIEPVVRECHRILSSTGSLLIHCDYHADSYIRCACDAIFGEDQLRNVLTWVRHNGSFLGKFYGQSADTIFHYTKSDEFYFEKQAGIKDKRFPFREEKTGRFFDVHTMIKKGREGEGPGELKFSGDRKYRLLNDKQRFVWSQKTLELRLKENPDLISWSGSGVPRYKEYADECNGTQLSSVWSDIKELRDNAKKGYLGYPTQKPEPLLERLLLSVTKIGDIILDPFCGSGTTLAVARKKNRRFIGIDKNPSSCRTTGKRIGIDVTNIAGYPATEEQLKEINDYEFQCWVADKMNANVGLRGKGPDAITIGRKHIIEVKQRKVGTDDVLKFEGDMHRFDYKIGAIVGFEITSPALDEIKRIKEGGDATIKTIKFYNIQDLNNGLHFDDNFSEGKKKREIIEPEKPPPRFKTLADFGGKHK